MLLTSKDSDISNKVFSDSLGFSKALSTLSEFIFRLEVSVISRIREFNKSGLKTLGYIPAPLESLSAKLKAFNISSSEDKTSPSGALFIFLVANYYYLLSILMRLYFFNKSFTMYTSYSIYNPNH